MPLPLLVLTRPPQGHDNSISQRPHTLVWHYVGGWYATECAPLAIDECARAVPGVYDELTTISLTQARSQMQATLQRTCKKAKAYLIRPRR